MGRREKHTHTTHRTGGWERICKARTGCHRDDMTGNGDLWRRPAAGGLRGRGTRESHRWVDKIRAVESAAPRGWKSSIALLHKQKTSSIVKWIGSYNDYCAWKDRVMNETKPSGDRVLATTIPVTAVFNSKAKMFEIYRCCFFYFMNIHICVLCQRLTNKCTLKSREIAALTDKAHYK